MESPSSRRPDEVESVYSRTLAVIRSALVSYYRLTDEEAGGVEEDLYVWFRRLSRRGGAGQMPIKLLRISLLSAACQYGRTLQLWKLGGEQSLDADLNDVLSREPDEVASDLERRAEEIRS